MKNWKKLALFAMVGTILLVPSEVNAASLSFSDMTVKNAFLVISIVVILLLLYLGYRMDSNEGTPREKKSKKKEFVDSKANYVKKQTEEVYTSNDTEYEEDSREYEVDNVNPEDISESVEYEEDNSVYQPDEEEEEDFEDIDEITSKVEPEKSLFESSNNDFGETISFDSSALNKEINNDIEDIAKVEEEEELGEEFDTSIIDKIDDDIEDEVFSTSVPKSTTVVEEYEEIVEEEEDFGEEFDTSIIDEIDDDFEDISTNETFSNKIETPVVEEEEEEFQGFSVSTSKAKTPVVEDDDEIEKIEEIEEIPVIEEKPKKRYTKVSTKSTSTALDEDFMRQMEANLEVGVKEEVKPAKKTSTRKKKAE